MTDDEYIRLLEDANNLSISLLAPGKADAAKSKASMSAEWNKLQADVVAEQTRRSEAADTEQPTFIAGDAVQGETRPVELSDKEVTQLNSTLRRPPVDSKALSNILDSHEPLKDTTNE